jgi:hypothetical protein
MKTLLNLYPTADYNATRNASIQAAINLYESNSCEVINVTNAWYAVGIGNEYATPLNITSNTTWSGSRILDAKVTIISNATLTITGTVYATEGVVINIEPGAKVILDGGTLTNACPDKLWHGILVSGNKYLPQPPQNQGVLELKNGAVIENAYTHINYYILLT